MMKQQLKFDSPRATHTLTQVADLSHCTLSVIDGAATDIYYNPINQTINYVTTIPDGGYFAVGYGTNMLKTDMVVWFASASNSSQLQLYSPTMDMPEILATNSYVTSFVSLIETTQFFTSRTLIPTQEDTYVIPLD
jgi:hypothetical protein